MKKYLYEDESKSILKKKMLQLALVRYMYREDKIKEKTNKIYEVLFVQCTPSLQSVLKGVPNHENKSKDYNCLWLMEYLKKHDRRRSKIKPKAVPNITDHIISHCASRANCKKW